MAAVYVVLRLNASRMKDLNVALMCDNQSVVAMLWKYRPPLRRPDLMWLVTRIAELCLHFCIWPWYEWIEGTANVTADRLSRFHPDPFGTSSHSPTVDQSETASSILTEALEATASMDVAINLCVFE